MEQNNIEKTNIIEEDLSVIVEEEDMSLDIDQNEDLEVDDEEYLTSISNFFNRIADAKNKTV